MPIRADALAVMAKAPIPGSVKTRLVPFFSSDEAAELARALLLDQLNHLSAFSSVDRYLAFSPRDAGGVMRLMAPDCFELFSQTGGDLGARMQHIFATLFAKGHKKIILIGADVPPVPLSHFAQAFAYLNDPESCAVLGPSCDGGYYLIGLNRESSEIFVNMTWSDEQVLARTLARLAPLGVKTWQLPGGFDIDTSDDVQRLLLRRASHEKDMKHTFDLLDRLEVSQRWSGERSLPDRTKS